MPHFGNAKGPALVSYPVMCEQVASVDLEPNAPSVQNEDA